MAYCPIGFHTGPGGNATGIGDYFRALDAAGRPAVLKSVDSYGVCRELAALRRRSGVPHAIAFRMAGGALELPDYELPPEQSAEDHWQRVVANLPPEMLAHNDQEVVWLEVISEPSKRRADWLGWFMFHIAELALDEGFRICGPGWATGVPEKESWEEPGWLAYLRLCEQNHDRVGIALHEYSLSNEDIFNGDGYLIGRFRRLFDVCDAHEIARPKVWITEWGWHAESIPAPEIAMVHIDQAATYYAQFPEILGAATWYLGPGFGGIANQTQKLIEPLTTYALGEPWSSENAAALPGGCRGVPRTQYSRNYQLLHEDLSEADAISVFRTSLPLRRTVGWSADDAGIGDLDSRTVEVYGWPREQRDSLAAWYRQHYPGVMLSFQDNPGESAVLTTPEGQTECRGLPRVQYERIYQLLHGSLSNQEAVAVFRSGIPERRTTGWSFDDAAIGDLDKRTIIIFGAPVSEQDSIQIWYAEHYPGVQIEFQPAPPPDSTFWLANPVGRDVFITSAFGEPRDYDGDGINEQRHEGLDFAGLLNGQPVPVYAAQDGVVTRVTEKSTGYGNHVVIRHDWPDNETYFTWYAHLSQIVVQPGQPVSRGQQIGMTGASGNATGVHLHLNLQHTGEGLSGFVIPDVVDPLPYLREAEVGAAALGLHTTDALALGGGELETFKEAKADLVKCISGLRNADVVALAHALPHARWLIRTGYSLAGRSVNPTQYLEHTLPDIQRLVKRLEKHDVAIELHHEPNHVTGGLHSSWSDGAAFQGWFLVLLNRFRAAVPQARFFYPALDAGGTLPGLRQDYLKFLQQSVEAVRAADGLALHAYWSAGEPMGATLQMIDDVIDFLEMHEMPLKPIYISEAGNSHAGTRPEDAAAEALTFWHEMRRRPTVQGVVFMQAESAPSENGQQALLPHGVTRQTAGLFGARLS